MNEKHVVGAEAFGERFKISYIRVSRHNHLAISINNRESEKEERFSKVISKIIATPEIMMDLLDGKVIVRMSTNF